jgi:hypothetical protein
MNEMNDDTYGDSDFLAQRDTTIHDFRASDKESKRKIIEKMLTLRHNMKYNKHLISVYMKAKGLFDTMVEEHRSQLYYLDEIYSHINQLIRENLSTMSKKPNGMMSELIMDKKRIGTLLKKMRNSYDKLMNVDTVIGVTIDKMNEITFMDDDARRAEEDGSDSGIDEDDGEQSEAEYDADDIDDIDDSEEEEEEEEEEDEQSEDEEDEDAEQSQAEEDDDEEEESEAEEEESEAEEEQSEAEEEESEAQEDDEEDEEEEPIILMY